MSEQAYRIGETVRRNRHYLTNDELMEKTGYDADTVISSVQWLVEKGMLKQDGRSRQQITDLSAYF